jgi:hypothetical protein
MFPNVISFYGEELLATCPTPNLGDHPLSVVRNCLFNVSAGTFHIWRPFLHRNLRTPHNVSTRTYAQEIHITFPSHSTKLSTQITDLQNAVYEVFCSTCSIHTHAHKKKSTPYKHTRRTAWASKLLLPRAVSRAARGKKLVDYLTA